MVNRTGATFVNFLAAEASATAADIVRAYTLAREIFDLEPLWDEIDALDYRVSSTLQLDLLGKLIAIAQRASRWMLRLRIKGADMPTLIARYQPGARDLSAHLGDWLPKHAIENWAASQRTTISGGRGRRFGRAPDRFGVHFSCT